MQLDRAFLDKFKRGSTYCRNFEEYVASIVEEVRNIMSCRLRNYDGVGKSPFCYGLMNLISASHDELEIFKKKCCQAILSLEPRISDIEISEIAVDSEKQEIALDILCIVKLNGEKINRKLML